MISVLLSEGLAPSNGPNRPEPPRESSRDAKDESFASYVDSNDKELNADPAPKQGEEAQATALETSESNAQPQTPKSEPTPFEFRDLDTSKLTADSDDASIKQDAGKTANAALATAELAPDASADIKTSAGQVVDATALKETTETLQTLDAEAANAETPRQTRSEDAPLIRPTNTEAVDADASTAKTASEPESSAQISTRFADAGDQAPEDNAQSSRLSETPQAGDLETASADVPRMSELADKDAQKSMIQTAGIEKSVLTNVAREIASPVSLEAPLTVAPTTTANSAAPVPTGLTPTAPTQVIAAPSELTNVILNAVKNGGDAPEQLVVQLDPPELGRVLIDFKFDAQGVQQITVTTENPEALKRLRELHFELTEALKEQGLSDNNLSFKQQAEDQSRQNWSGGEFSRAQSQMFAAEDGAASISATPPPSLSTARDRLDLLL